MSYAEEVLMEGRGRLERGVYEKNRKEWDGVFRRYEEIVRGVRY